MARKSRAAPPTIAQMMKLEAAMKAKQAAYYKASDAFGKYQGRVKGLGAGYAETVDGVVHVIAITPAKYERGTEMTIVKVKQ